MKTETFIDWFIICPYSHEDSNIRQQRFEIANRVSAELLKQGYIVYSPISLCHPIAIQEKLPLGSAFWKKQNDTMIYISKKIMVIDIDGWKESGGCQAEIELAGVLEKEIVYWSDYKI